MATPIYRYRIGKTSFSAEVRFEDKGLVVVELLDGKPDGEGVPIREYIKDNPEWGEEVRKTAKRLLTEMG